jgi:hypothetical protein
MKLEASNEVKAGRISVRYFVTKARIFASANLIIFPTNVQAVVTEVAV